MTAALTPPTRVAHGTTERLRSGLRAWSNDLRYLLSACLPVLAVAVVVGAGWHHRIGGAFSYLVHTWLLTLPTPLQPWDLTTAMSRITPVAEVLVGLVTLVVLARCWAPVVHERTARYLGRPDPIPLTRLAGGPRRRLKAFVLGGETWRRALWFAGNLVLGTLAVAPILLALDGLRGLFFLTDFTRSLYVVNLLAPDTLGLHVHDTNAGWLAACGLEVVVSAGVLGVLVPRLARWNAALTTSLLKPDPAAADTARLTARVADLTRSREGAVDAHGAELRRIERDLHDGTQARLVDATMRLGMAERAADTDPATMLSLVRDARSSTEEAMAELRTVLRTLYPPVLADRGLRGALSGLGSRCTVPTTVRLAPDLGELSAPVEAAAYYLVAESLTNVVKHSVAEHVEVEVARTGDTLRIRVTDDGLGGADETRGTGITGMRRRVEALDGWLDVTGPLGGPTTVLAEIPCGS